MNISTYLHQRSQDVTCTLFVMSFCPSCGCGIVFQDEMQRIGDETIAHYENCRGGCWRAVGTPFAQAVERRLAGRP